MENSKWEQIQPIVKKPAVKWLNVGESHVLYFVNGTPKEFISQFKTAEDEEKTVFVFDVKEGEEDKVLFASAWTLVKGLKTAGDLTGRTFKITRILKNGKNVYTVEETNVLVEEA